MRYSDQYGPLPVGRIPNDAADYLSNRKRYSDQYGPLPGHIPPDAAEYLGKPQEECRYQDGRIEVNGKTFDLNELHIFD